MFPQCRKSLTRFPYMLIQIMYKSKKPERIIYHRVRELDEFMEIRKTHSMILHLKSIIQSQRKQYIRLRDVEKEVGFVNKWTYIDVIWKHPGIFRVSRGHGVPPMVSLTEEAQQIAALEGEAKEQMEPILVRNLRKLLMLSVDCMVPLETIEFIRDELGLPNDFERVLIPKYPHFFTVKNVEGREHLCLEKWDSSLAVTAREERLAREGFLKPRGYVRKGKISKDGNVSSPFAFRLKFAVTFRKKVSYLKEVQNWQMLEFPSPYLNARSFDFADPGARKRVVGVLHELFSLTMEKKLTFAQVEAFQWEYRFPTRLLLCLIKYHGMFYITNEGGQHTVFLKEAYDRSNLIDKCPLMAFRARFIGLSGEEDTSSTTRIPFSRAIP